MVQNIRKSQRLFRYAVDIFITLLCQVTKRKTINYKCNDSDTSAWNNFMEEMEDNIGEDFVRKFVEYGVQSWINSGTEKDYSRIIRISWIFGKPAIERWRKYDIATNVYITRIGLKKDHNINLIKHKSNISELVQTIRPSEEKFKEEYHNSRRGLAWCIANTTLYFHKSSWCAKCQFKKECKDIMKEQYPKVYKIRGYDIR